jgi:hypothetical protein
MSWRMRIFAMAGGMRGRIRNMRRIRWRRIGGFRGLESEALRAAPLNGKRNLRRGWASEGINAIPHADPSGDAAGEVETADETASAGALCRVRVRSAGERGAVSGVRLGGISQESADLRRKSGRRFRNCFPLKWTFCSIHAPRRSQLSGHLITSVLPQERRTCVVKDSRSWSCWS